MSIPLISAVQLRECLTFADLIEPMEVAFRQSSAGRARSDLIVLFPHPDKTKGDVYVKAGTLEGAPFFVVKVAPWFAANVEANLPQGGVVALFDSTNGHCVALIEDEHYLSDIRTAAAGAVAAQALAPERLHAVGVLGAGVQAYWQALALYRVRPFERLRIWARNAEKSKALAGRLLASMPEVCIEIAAEPETVVTTSDAVITATVAREPIVQGEWLRPGQHLTAVGADDATKCEIAASALCRAAVFVDSVEATIANGDVYRAIADGGYEPADLSGEIGQVLSGDIPGRTSSEQITIAKLLGIGAQDLVAATVAVAKLRESGALSS